MEQRTDEWALARCGKVTGSNFWKVFAVSKKDKKPLKDRQDYLIQIVTEKLTGTPIQHFVNDAMRWGTAYEDEARAYYQLIHNMDVREYGFIEHRVLDVGCSPDGLIGEDGGIEIKCPTSATHLETLMNGMNEHHMYQVQGLMWLAELDWVDFISYDPRMPDDLKLYVQRVERDPEFVGMLESGIIEFLREVDAFINKLPRAA
jgi:hypothetical protein